MPESQGVAGASSSEQKNVVLLPLAVEEKENLALAEAVSEPSSGPSVIVVSGTVMTLRALTGDLLCTRTLWESDSAPWRTASTLTFFCPPGPTRRASTIASASTPTTRKVLVVLSLSPSTLNLWTLACAVPAPASNHATPASVSARRATPAIRWLESA
jgi:hypothetical protein